MKKLLLLLSFVFAIFIHVDSSWARPPILDFTCEEITYSCGDGSGTPPTLNTLCMIDETYTAADNTCTPPAGGTFSYWDCNDIEYGHFTMNAGESFVLGFGTVCTAQYTVSTVTCSSGYYLPANSDTCATCPSGYICPGGDLAQGTGSDQGKYIYTVTYSCGSGGGTAPANGYANNGESFTPAGGTCGAPNGYMFSGWLIDGTNTVVQSGVDFTYTYSSDKTFTAQYTEPVKFSLTTTSLNANDTFQFTMSTQGTFYVDCGDGGTLSGTGVSGTTITKSSATNATYTCTYSTGGAKTILFGGTATAYGMGSPFSFSGFKTKISSISGNLSTLFPYLGARQYPRFSSTFADCTNLTSIPENLFSGYTTGASGMFQYTFSGCTSLTSIPAGLFSNITTGADSMFSGTFNGCTGLTSISAGLFSGITTGASHMFANTFNGCTGLTSLPVGLFSNITTTTGATYMFNYTFQGCTGLTSIPGDLFSGITTGATYMFGSTFNGCTGLTSIPVGLFSNITTSAGDLFHSTFSDCTSLTSIPGNLFSGITTGASYMFASTFSGCTGLTSIPGNLFSGITTGATYMFMYTFRNCTGLTSIPAGLFSNITTTTGAYAMFGYTFYGCTGLTSIPGNLFSGITTGADSMFSSTFYGCTGLTSIPAGLFSRITTGAKSMFNSTFNGCTGLTSIPGNLFSGITTGATYMFMYTFSGCTGLTSIPAGLFSGITTGANVMFSYTFYGCTGLTSIPENLFSNITTGADSMFSYTFYGCTGLTSIPAGLFSRITTGAKSMFNSTFNGCTGLTSIPGNLFSGITTGADSMFSYTFSGCTNLAGYIPPSTFAGLIANGHPTADYMWRDTFTNTQLVTSCPSGTTQYTTGYEGTDTSTYTKWNGKVSCEPKLNVTYSCGSGGGIAPASTTTTYNASFTPAASTCIAPNGYMFSGWLIDGTNTVVQPGTAFTYTYSSDKTLTAQYTKFTLITTPTDSFEFKMAAIGTFFVDCGDGGTLSGTGASGTTITRTDTTEVTYACSWSTSTAHTIRFSGTAKEYNKSVATIKFNITNATPDENAMKIASLSGNLSAIFPYFGVNGSGLSPIFYQTFYGATNLQSIPETLFASYTGNLSGATYMFYNTFQGCTGLTSLPAALFPGITTGASNMFDSMFNGCTGLTSIPAGLFSGITTGASGMFSRTFSGCTGLTSIPADLFSGITTGVGSLFNETFSGCTGLTSIPAGLFSRITTGASTMFYSTFKGCTGLVSLPAGLFSGITTGVSNMFYHTFENCTGLTSIPAGLFSGITTGASEMFSHTFENCTGLTSIPENLFSGITTGVLGMFAYTFNGCTNITGYIPPSTFAGLIANGHPTANFMWQGAFTNTQLVTSCPSGTTQYTTGYEGTDTSTYTKWNGKVSCQPTNALNVTYSCGTGFGTPPASTTATYNASFTPAASTCSKTGYSFNGWLVSDEGVVKPAGTAFTWDYVSDKTFTAQYSTLYNVTYDCGTGGGTAPIDSNSPYASGSSVTTLSNTCTAPNGKQFSKWLCGSTNVNPGSTFTISTNTTCTAQWFSNTINLIWDNGAYDIPSSCALDSTFVPPTPEPRPGYIFTGWKVRPTCSMTGVNASISGSSYGYQNDRTGSLGANSSNTSTFGITTDSTWAVQFSYGTVWGETDCSGSSNLSNTCYCRVKYFQPTGGERCTVSQNPWVYARVYNMSDRNGTMVPGADVCAYECAYGCAWYISSNASIRATAFGQ